MVIDSLDRSAMKPKPKLLGLVHTTDGHAIRYAVFRTTAYDVTGTVVILQGRNESIEKYEHVITDITKRGFDVVAFDWRGQGGSTRFFSDGRPGYVDRFEQYLDDLEQVFTEIALPECRPPFFALGHSTGSLVALLAAPQLTNRFHRMVLVSPFLSLDERALTTGQINALSTLLCFFGLGRMYVGGSHDGAAAYEFEDNRLTTDRASFERNKTLLHPSGGLGLGGPTAGWLRAATEAIAKVGHPDHMAKIHVPTMIVAGGADRLTSTSDMEDYAHRLRSGSLLMIEGARHEILQEAPVYREQFFAAFDAFVPGTSKWSEFDI